MGKVAIDKLSSNLKKLLAIQDITVSQLAKEINEPQSTISRIVLGQTQRPKKKIIKKIAYYFNISEEELVGEKEIEWGKVNGWINTLINKANAIPLCLWTLDDNYKVQEIPNTPKINIPTSVSYDAFALKVKDSSMEPLFPIDSIIVCDPRKEASHDSYVIIALENTKLLVFRKLLQDINTNYIKPLNKDFGSSHIHMLKPSDKIIAVVVHVQYDIL